MMNGKKLMVFSLCLCMLLSSTACMKEETTLNENVSSSVVEEQSSSSEVIDESSLSEVIEEVSSSSEVIVEQSSSEVVESSAVVEETSSSSEVVEQSSSQVAEQPKVEQTTQQQQTTTANVTYSTSGYTEYSNGTVTFLSSNGTTKTGKIPQGAIKDNNGNYIVKQVGNGNKPYYYVGENPIDIGIQHNGTSFYVSPTNKGTLQNPVKGDIVYIGDVMYSYKNMFGKMMWFGTAYNPDVSYVEPADIIEFQGRDEDIKWG